MSRCHSWWRYSRRYILSSQNLLADPFFLKRQNRIPVRDKQNIFHMQKIVDLTINFQPSLCPLKHTVWNTYKQNLHDFEQCRTCSADRPLLAWWAFAVTAAVLFPFNTSETPITISWHVVSQYFHPLNAFSTAFSSSEKTQRFFFVLTFRFCEKQESNQIIFSILLLFLHCMQRRNSKSKAQGQLTELITINSSSASVYSNSVPIKHTSCVMLHQ